MTKQNLPGFIRRDVERAIEHALHPTGMSAHDGKARIGVDRLQYLIRMIDGLEPVNDGVLEFLRAFIAGGVNQDFKLWASELYQKLYRSTVEPSVRLTEMSFKAKEGEPFEATGQFQGDAVKEWSLAMVQWFREKGGINYVACDLSDPTTGERYAITMQKAGGRTPAQDLCELRSQLNRQAEPTANVARGMCQISNRPACDTYPNCQCGQTLPPGRQGAQ